MVMRKEKYVPLYDAKMMQTTTKEATAYDWGDMGIDLGVNSCKDTGCFCFASGKRGKRG